MKLFLNSRWRTGATVKKTFLTIIQQLIVLFQRHFAQGSNIAWQKSLNLENSRWRTAAILQIVKSLYLNEKPSDFDEIWHTIAHWNSITVTWPNMIFLNAKWRTADKYWKSFLAITQQLIARISVKFCVGKPFFTGFQYVTHIRLPQDVFFITRQYADGRYWYSNFVCSSVRQVPVFMETA